METAPVEYRSARRIRVGANSRMTELQRSHAELRRRTMARGLLPAVTQIGGRGEHLFRLCGDVPRVPLSTCETVAMVTPGFLAISFGPAPASPPPTAAFAVPITLEVLQAFTAFCIIK